MSAPVSNSSESVNPFSDVNPFDSVNLKPILNGFTFTLALGGAVLFVAGVVALAAAGALFAPPVAAAIGLAGFGLIAAQASLIWIGLNIVGAGLSFVGLSAAINFLARKMFTATE